MTLWITMFCLSLLAATAVAIARTRSLLAASMLLGIYSLLGACWQVVLDAPDVAFTEAAVGAGISTVLLLAALHLTTDEEAPSRGFEVWPLVITLLTGGMLVYGTLDMPEYGDASAPIHHHVVPSYLAGDVGTHPVQVGMVATSAASVHREPDEHAHGPAPHSDEEHHHEIGVPNVVTAVLASYRGYDTLGETTVVFTAGIGCLVLLAGRRREDEEPS